MPWNGTGGFNLTYVWVQDAANGIPITASRMDTQETDMSSAGFGNCVTRDGQSPATANIPMGGFRITGVAPATSTGDALTNINNRYTNFTNASTVVTASSTYLMGGFGSAWTLTPNATGRVRMRVTGFIEQSNASSSATTKLYYGTGTAPVQGAAVTGTAGTTSEWILSGLLGIVPLAMEFEVTGLTLSTAYWFDVALRAPGNTNATTQPISVIIEEF